MATVIARSGVVPSHHHSTVREDLSHALHHKQVGSIRPAYEDDIADTCASAAAYEHAITGM